MVSTIKFSQFNDGGNLANGETTVGVSGSTNERFNNPWTFLPSGTIGDRPAPDVSMYYRLRLNTETQLYEYYNPITMVWDELDGGGISLPLAIVDGGTGADTAAGARTNLGLGTLAVQDANAVAITGGTAAFTTGSVTAAPIAGTDLVNKTYADSLVSTTVLAKYWVSTSTPSLTNSINLGALTTGLLKIGVSGATATPATASNGVDYWAPGDVLTLPAPPTMPSDATTKAYVDALVSGHAFKDPCVCSTTANLSATYANGAAGVGATLTATGNGAFASDGISPSMDDRILVAFESTPAQNGIYTLTTVGDGGNPYVLTRATDYDSGAEIQPGDTVLVEQGTLYHGTLWFQSAVVVTVGTDPILFTELAFISLPISLVNGGTNASLTASNGGIVYSGASAFAVLAGTATAGQMLQSGASSAPAWSTATWPATTTINRLLYSSANNIVNEITNGTTGQVLTATTGGAPSWQAAAATGTVNSGLLNQLAYYATAGTAVSGLSIVNNAGLLTNGSGLPGWVAYTGSGAPVLATSPRLVTSILDTNGNFLLGLNPAPGAVNYITISNNTIGNPPYLIAQGSDTNIDLYLESKGTGGVAVQGTKAGGDANVGFVGEYTESVIDYSSPVTFTTAISQNLTSISLSAGDWDVWGNFGFRATTITAYETWINSVSNSAPNGQFQTYIPVVSPTSIIVLPQTQRRFNLTTTTTIYISGLAQGTGTILGFGFIAARRVR